jgi:hypothetical protein
VLKSYRFGPGRTRTGGHAGPDWRPGTPGGRTCAAAAAARRAPAWQILEMWTSLDRIHKNSRAALVAFFLIFVVIVPSSASDGADAVDLEAKSLEIMPIDRETCQQNGDCEDWCKEKGQNDTRDCVCRCEKWISEADFNCKNGTTYCQVRRTRLSK